MHKIYICTNDAEPSKQTFEKLSGLFKENGFELCGEFSDSVELVVSIGGDGTFLRTLKKINFSPVPVLGVNTGHLGFFTEFIPSELGDLAAACGSDSFVYETHKLIETKVFIGFEEIALSPALNDVLVERNHSSLIHLDLFIGPNCIESFAGDGLLISSSAGSTAYNYSLGGSVVDPRLSLLQITPMAPVNNASYRNLTSSLLVPQEETVTVVPIECKDVNVVIDGEERDFSGVDRIEFSLSDRRIKIARLPGFNFWQNVKEKFL